MAKVQLQGKWIHNKVIIARSDAARDLSNNGVYGTLLKDGTLQLGLLEATYLFEKGKVSLVDGHNKELTLAQCIKKAQRKESEFLIRYAVFKDFRDRGYVIKTALKFGADFRVYERGIKPGEDHAKWVVFPVSEGETLTWQDFSAKNRVAHSTKKRLLVGVVDDELSVTYWEARWMRP